MSMDAQSNVSARQCKSLSGAPSPRPIVGPAPTSRWNVSESFLAGSDMFVALLLARIARLVYTLPPFRSGVVRRTTLSGFKKGVGIMFLRYQLRLGAACFATLFALTW